MEEVWKDVPGYEGYYQVSNTGKVRSVDRVIEYKDGRVFKYPTKILKSKADTRGYLQVGFSVKGKNTNHRIHRLVAETFLEKPNIELISVNHIDGVKTNNNLDNLEWVSYSENTRKGYKIGLFEKARKTAKERWKGNKLQCKPVKIFIKSTNEELTFESARAASRYVRQCENYFTELLRRGGENKKFKVTQHRYGQL
ncbi:endonuclease [Staphylococcus schleiferi subsp. coagulans]|uniref:NUMOD4 domain-containing protein n=2 Tax=Staphylococcus coagulans TaxID=74706 RepID=UPI0015FC2930|nr:NUMOD4 domain-containing protein [Staphylococcus coagulans]MBA8773108.1 endonuclease [Staphylococcus coagulans]